MTLSKDPIIQAWYVRLLKEAESVTGPAKLALSFAVLDATGSPEELETVLVKNVQKTKNDMRLKESSRKGQTLGYRLALIWLRQEMGLLPRDEE